MARRCKSWRPVLGVHNDHLSHEPGRCHVCWVPCRSKVGPDVVMCETCESLLSRHPSARVRAALTRHPNTCEATLRYLVDDGDFNVKLAASNALAERDGAHLFDAAVRRT